MVFEKANQTGVHASHCCVYHGCKYFDDDCPVISGETHQQYPCEECMYDPMLEVVDHLNELIDQTPVDKIELLNERIKLKGFVVETIRKNHGCGVVENE